MIVAEIDRQDWHLVMCPRVATAPLRFMGRLIDEREAGLPGLRFAVYERQKGGLTAILPGCSRGAWRDDALRANGWGDLFDEVERRCGNLAPPPRGKRSDQEILNLQMRFATERDRVLDAAGRALDHWQRLAEAQAGQR